MYMYIHLADIKFVNFRTIGKVIKSLKYYAVIFSIHDFIITFR